MKIGLIDVDGHNFPNLALMKISAFHKQRNDEVEWVNAVTGKYDKVYMSKIFDESPEYTTCIDAGEIVRGGRAYNKKIKLPPEIETIYPDYSLYGITDTAYGYLTRGCPRACGFCDVKNIEGTTTFKVANLDQFWHGQKNIKLLDPNILAYKGHDELLEQLIESKSWIEFNSGLDIRFTNNHNVNLIKRLKIKIIHFAWDNPKEDLVDRFKQFKEATGINRRKLTVYVLVNYDSTHEQDLYRIYTLKELGYDPFVMIYKDGGKAVPERTRQLARWVDRKTAFAACARFENYKRPTKKREG